MKILKNLILALIIAAALASCSPLGGFGGSAGSITINIGEGALTANRAAGYPSQTSNGLLPYLTHKVTLKGNGAVISKTFASGQTTITMEAVPAGTYTVTLDSYYGSYHVGAGTSSVIVTGGQSSSCSTIMKQADPSAILLMASNAAEWDNLSSDIQPAGKYIVFITNDITGVTGVYSSTFGAAATSIDVTITGDYKITLAGGGLDNLLYISATQSVTLVDTDLIGNTTVGASLVNVNGAGASFTMEGSSSVSRNTANSNTSGGVYVSNGGVFTMNSGTISDNNGGLGGGVYVTNNGTFNMNSGTISDNTASADGGGVYVSSGGVFNMNGGTVSNNTASAGGGGVYVISSGTFTMTNGTVSNNTAISGGGVCVNNSTFDMKDGAVSDNNASTGGGGVYVTNYGTFNMNSGTMLRNTTNTDGGGVYVSALSTFNMTGGMVSDNNASTGGGGVYVMNSTGTFRLQTGNLTGNTAVQSRTLYVGAGATAQSGTFTTPGVLTSWIPNGTNLTSKDDDLIVANGLVQ